MPPTGVQNLISSGWKQLNGVFLAHWGLSGHRLVFSHSPEQTSYSVHLPSIPSTQIQVVSAAHQPLAHASCGTEGFRNAKKGTGIAAQTAGIAAAAVGVSVCVCARARACVFFPAPSVLGSTFCTADHREEDCPCTSP